MAKDERIEGYMRFRTGVAAVLAAALVATGCGGGDKDKSSAAPAKADPAQAAQADASAKSTVRTAVTEMEACFVDAASYAGCKPSTAGVQVSDVTDAGYTLTTKSTAGNSFAIAKTSTGLGRTCTTEGQGGCPAGGAW
jgi:hypothetical protein